MQVEPDPVLPVLAILLLASQRSDVLRCAASGITTTLAWTLLNAGVALFGYYMTAWLIDNINWGRYRIQVSAPPK